MSSGYGRAREAEEAKRRRGRSHEGKGRTQKEGEKAEERIMYLVRRCNTCRTIGTESQAGLSVFRPAKMVDCPPDYLPIYLHRSGGAVGTTKLTSNCSVAVAYPQAISDLANCIIAPGDTIDSRLLD